MRTDGHTCLCILFRRTSACKNFFTNFFFTLGNFSEVDVSNLDPLWRRARAGADVCSRPYSFAHACTRCRVERSLLWEITGSLAAAGNDSRVGKQFLFSKPKIVVKQTVFNRAHTKDPRPTSSIQR